MRRLLAMAHRHLCTLDAVLRRRATLRTGGGLRRKGEKEDQVAVKPIPEGYHSITPYLVVDDAAAELSFLKRALGAEERFKTTRPDGTIGHAEVRIGDSMVM